MGLLPDLSEGPCVWKSRAWVAERPHEFVRGWDALCRGHPLADDHLKMQWRRHLEAATFPEAEVQRIKKIMAVLKDDGYCSLTVETKWKLKNSKRPKPPHDPEAVLETTDLPELERWNEIEQMWEPRSSEKRSIIPALNVEPMSAPRLDSFAIGHDWVGPGKSDQRAEEMLRRLSMEERRKTRKILSIDWIGNPHSRNFRLSDGFPMRPID